MHTVFIASIELVEVVAGDEDNVHSEIILVSFIAKDFALTVPIDTEHAAFWVTLDLGPCIDRVFRGWWKLIPVLLSALMEGKLMLDVFAIFPSIKSDQILDVAWIILHQSIQVTLYCKRDAELCLVQI